MEAMTYYDVWSHRREQRLDRRQERQNMRQTRKGLIKTIRSCNDVDKLYAAGVVFRCDEESPRLSPFD